MRRRLWFALGFVALASARALLALGGVVAVVSKRASAPFYLGAGTLIGVSIDAGARADRCDP